MDHQGRDTDRTTDAIELVYKPARADILSAVRVRESYRRLTWVRWVAAALLLAWGILPMFAPASRGPAVVPMLLGAFVWAIPHLYASQALRIVQWQGDYRTTVTEDGVTAVNDHCALTQRWTLFRGHRETADSFVLLSRDRGVMWVEVLPKRGLRDPEDADRLRATLGRHLPQL
ncbi:YcxB family protein [Streptomyces sp. ISL-10]|uniref:YcxB family protein n=1 Tax=Streptomyces sp. ISL-10 TaxID=2819172 RepID=UPI001BE5CA29|nr:YcxB family protein [Streptomyces sp. ISL-10]MBT2368250.1 YcxB family protein [Streptomyces sp. ISL-10]